MATTVEIVALVIAILILIITSVSLKFVHECQGCANVSDEKAYWMKVWNIVGIVGSSVLIVMLIYIMSSDVWGGSKGFAQAERLRQLFRTR